MAIKEPKARARSTPATEPLLVTVAEAARLLACTKATIYRRVQRKELQATDRGGNAMRITTASIKGYIERETR